MDPQALWRLSRKVWEGASIPGLKHCISVGEGSVTKSVKKIILKELFDNSIYVITYFSSNFYIVKIELYLYCENKWLQCFVIYNLISGINIHAYLMAV